MKVPISAFTFLAAAVVICGWVVTTGAVTAWSPARTARRTAAANRVWATARPVRAPATTFTSAGTGFQRTSPFCGLGDGAAGGRAEPGVTGGPVDLRSDTADERVELRGADAQPGAAPAVAPLQGQRPGPARPGSARRAWTRARHGQSQRGAQVRLGVAGDLAQP